MTNNRLSVSIELITPEIAANYLRNKAINRGIKHAVVARYRRDIERDNWRLTHQGIAFNVAGQLIDGQHRLSAIVESGIAVCMVVTRGVPDEAQHVMDDHIKRSVADCLTIQSGERVAANDVAIVRAIVDYHSDEAGSYSTKLTRSELMKVFPKFAEPLEFARPFTACKTRAITAASVWGAIVLAWFYVEDLERLELFCRILTGQDRLHCAQDSAAHSLREWLLRSSLRVGGMRDEAYRKTQSAIGFFIDSIPVERLRGRKVLYRWPLTGQAIR